MIVATTFSRFLIHCMPTLSLWFFARAFLIGSIALVAAAQSVSLHPGCRIVQRIDEAVQRAGQLGEALEWILADKPAEHRIVVAAAQVVERGAGIKCLACITKLVLRPDLWAGCAHVSLSPNVV